MSLNASIDNFTEYCVCVCVLKKMRIQAGMKPEDILDPDALQAHINGMNSYMYNHTVESWM